jgi:hypothetical protein
MAIEGAVALVVVENNLVLTVAEILWKEVEVIPLVGDIMHSLLLMGLLLWKNLSKTHP